MILDPNKKKCDDEIGENPDFYIDLDKTPTLEEAQLLHEKMLPLFLTFDDLQSLLDMIEQGQKDQWINGRRVVSTLQNIEQTKDSDRKLTIIRKFIPMMSEHLQEYSKSDYIGHAAHKKRQFFLTAIQIGKNIMAKAQGEKAEADTDESTMEMQLDSHINRVIMDDIFHPEIAPCKNGSVIYGIDKGVPKNSSDGSENNRPNEDGMYIDTKQQFFLSADGMGGHGNGEVAVKIFSETLQNALNGTLTRDDLDLLKNPKNFIDTSLSKKKNNIPYMEARTFERGLPKLGPHKLTMEQIQYLSHRKMCEYFLSQPVKLKNGNLYDPSEYQKIKEMHNDNELALFYEKYKKTVLAPGLCYAGIQVTDNNLDIYRVGDVRVIVIDKDGKVRATKDEAHPVYKNIVLNAAMGWKSGNTNHYRFGRLHAGDRVVICSDGATDNFEGTEDEVNDKIAQIVHGKSLYDAENELFNHCKKTMKNHSFVKSLSNDICNKARDIKARLLDEQYANWKADFIDETVLSIRQTCESLNPQQKNALGITVMQNVVEHAFDIAKSLINGNDVPEIYLFPGKPDNINIIIYDHKG